MNNEKVWILGAGPAGLSIGYALAEKGEKVAFLEKEPVCGGLGRTFKKDGCYLDFGPHIIHTSKPDILAFLKRILGPDLIQRTAKIQIYFNNRFVPYPIRGLKVLQVLPFWKACWAMVSFLWARITLFLFDPKDDASFKSWITNRFGRVLYGIYFGPYAEKAWKIPASDISAYVAKKRVPTVGIADYLRSFLKKKPKRHHSEDPSCVEIYYPRYGIGQVVDYFEKGVRQHEGEIHTSVKVKDIFLEGDKVKSVRYEQNGVDQTSDVGFLFSTIPLNELIGLIRPAPPAEVAKAAQSLDYCAERLLYIIVNKPQVFEAPLVYFQNPKIKFNRVYGTRQHGPHCVPEGKEVLVIEFTCSVGDEMWNASDKFLYDEAMAVFTKIGALKQEEVDSYFTQRVTHAYPRFRINFQDHLSVIFKYLNSISNMTVLGRQGLFCYANVDEVIAMGFRALEIYPSLELKPIDYRHLFKEFLHLEEA